MVGAWEHRRRSAVSDGKNLHAVYDDVARVYESHPGCVSCTVVKVSAPRFLALRSGAVSVSSGALLRVRDALCANARLSLSLSLSLACTAPLSLLSLTLLFTLPLSLSSPSLSLSRARALSVDPVAIG